jgi:hypothetical protein
MTDLITPGIGPEMPSVPAEPKTKVVSFWQRLPLWGWGLAGVILLLAVCGILLQVTGRLWLAGRNVKTTPPAETVTPDAFVAVSSPSAETVTAPAGTPTEMLSDSTAETVVSMLWLDKTTFGPREPLQVHLAGPASFSDGAWVGLMPADVPHGTWNSAYDYISFEYLDRFTAGTIDFVAPDALGLYDFRIYDKLDREVASVTFTVISDEGKEATLRLDKTTFEQGEQIQVYFEVPSSFSHSAWLGMIPREVPHGDWKDSYGYVSYQNLLRRTAGVIDFVAPHIPGGYDFRLYDSTYGQEAVSVAFTVVAGEEKEASLWLDKTTFKPGEKIEVHFTAPASFVSTAWVGIIPSEVSPGEYKYDFPYQYLNRMTSGVLTFSVPETPGAYDLRMHDAGARNGREVTSVTFMVE